MAGFVDLHSHYLPQLDDGAKSIEMSLDMVRVVADLGFEELHATPHQRDGMFMPPRDAIDAAFADVRGLVAAGAPGLRLGLAAENFWDGVFMDRVQAGGAPSYPGDKAFLFELPVMVMPPALDNTLFQLRIKGSRLPVMAHPERYAALQEDLDRAASLAQRAALVVDLAALDGAHGRAEMKTARSLVQQGLAHAAATDIHKPQDGKAVAAGMAWIKKTLGAGALARLLSDNPRRILTGDLP